MCQNNDYGKRQCILMKDLEQLLNLNYKVNGLYSVFFKKHHLDWIYGVFLCLLMETSFLIFMFENNQLLFLELAFTDMVLCFTRNPGYCWLHLVLRHFTCAILPCEAFCLEYMILYLGLILFQYSAVINPKL